LARRLKIVFDIEANAIENPTKIWVIVCRDVDTGKSYVFRNPVTDEESRSAFDSFSRDVSLWIGHNILGYDLIHIERLLGLVLLKQDCSNVVDTLVISKLVNYSRPGGHSIEQYGEEFGYPKIKFSDFSKYSEEMEEYCGRDVEICERVYRKYKRIIDDPQWAPSIQLEQQFQLVVNRLHTTGFGFNVDKASRLLVKVEKELSELDEKIKEQFPPKLKLVREVTPKETKHGTISLSSIPLAIRKAEGGDLSAYQPDAPFSFCAWSEFNPSSHKQLIEVLTEAGWSPVDKTKTHIETERELNRLRYQKGDRSQVDTRTQELYNDLERLKKYGWKINEENLSTLPPSAPSSAKSLAKRIMLESRRRTLTEWLGLVRDDGRIHGKFYGIGAWTHRMAHQNPNTANIPTGAKLFGDEMRSLWCAPSRKRLLVGVDAEGIQLRIFAHYINDPEFTEALVKGDKRDKTDPHSLNQRILGDVCHSRQAAKRCIYALLLGAGISKIAEILECSEPEAKEALDRLLLRYEGWQTLKREVLPKDGERGWFYGLDGRKVRIPGDTPGARKHLAMSGYLQNGEAIVMKKACLKWESKLKEYDACLVDFVHDEWQTECPNNMTVALEIAKMQADSLREVGEELNLNCPLAGSYWNEDLKDYTIGTNWKVTH
jgi:DNA polymerase-1